MSGKPNFVYARRESKKIEEKKREGERERVIKGDRDRRRGIKKKKEGDREGERRRERERGTMD